MTQDHIEALEAICRQACKTKVTAAHWATVRAVAKIVADAKRGQK